jgi:hypothetical protein
MMWWICGVGTPANVGPVYIGRWLPLARTESQKVLPLGSHDVVDLWCGVPPADGPAAGSNDGYTRAAEHRRPYLLAEFVQSVTDAPMHRCIMRHS